MDGAVPEALPRQARAAGWAAVLRGRARGAPALAARLRARLRADRSTPAAAARRLDRSGRRAGPRRTPGRGRAGWRRARTGEPAGDPPDHPGASGDRAEAGVRPALPALSAPSKPRPPPPRNHEHGRRGLPDRRRLVFDRQPGDEWDLPASHLDGSPRGDVRPHGEHRPLDRAALAHRGAVPVPLRSGTTCARWSIGSRT